MEQITLNKQLTLTFPDGFRKLDANEVKALSSAGSENAEALKNEEAHLMVSMGFKKAGGLAGLLLKEADMVKAAEKGIAKASAPFGYKLAGFGERTVGGKEAKSFRYTYTAQGVAMTGEGVVVKAGGFYYYLYLYAREALQDAGFAAWQEILDSARWAE